MRRRGPGEGACGRNGQRYGRYGRRYGLSKLVRPRSAQRIVIPWPAAHGTDISRSTPDDEEEHAAMKNLHCTVNLTTSDSQLVAPLVSLHLSLSPLLLVQNLFLTVSPSPASSRSVQSSQTNTDPFHRCSRRGKNHPHDSRRRAEPYANGLVLARPRPLADPCADCSASHDSSIIPCASP